MNCVLFAKNKTLKNNGKNTGKVRKFCQSGKVGSMLVCGSMVNLRILVQISRLTGDRHDVTIVNIIQLSSKSITM